MAKISENNVEHAEAPKNPEDVAIEAKGQDYANRRVVAFFASHQKKFIDLVSTYSDSEAQELFDNLREEFWARTWLKPGDPDAR